ncbi:hypothetical protein DFS34DRAFT_633464, partial [Phlyctochytrium arcticum]
MDVSSNQPTPDSGGLGGMSTAESDPTLMASFKAAAFSVTQLYKESVKQERRAFRSGYDQCLQDLWQFISANRGNSRDGAVALNDLVGFLSRKHEQLKDMDATEAGALGASNVGRRDGPPGDNISQQQEQQQQQHHQNPLPDQQEQHHQQSQQSLQQQRHHHEMDIPTATAPRFQAPSSFASIIPSSDFTFSMPLSPPSISAHPAHDHISQAPSNSFSSVPSLSPSALATSPADVFPGHAYQQDSPISSLKRRWGNSNMGGGPMPGFQHAQQQQFHQQHQHQQQPQHSQPPQQLTFDTSGLARRLNWNVDPFSGEPTVKRSRRKKDEM